MCPNNLHRRGFRGLSRPRVRVGVLAGTSLGCGAAGGFGGRSALCLEMEARSATWTQCSRPRNSARPQAGRSLTKQLLTELIGSQHLLRELLVRALVEVPVVDKGRFGDEAGQPDPFTIGGKRSTAVTPVGARTAPWLLRWAR